MHSSDCPAHDGLPCDCVPLDLTLYPSHRFVPALVTTTGRFGFFVGEAGRESFVEPQELPALTLAAVAAAANLPDTHDAIAVLRGANGMNLDDAREAIIAKLKAKTLAEGVTCGACLQLRISSST